MPSWLDDVQGLLARTPIGRFAAETPGVRAAVLVPLFVDGGKLWVLLERRSGSVQHHPGQVAFPGGVRHGEDVDEVATALRETHEELGIEPGQVMILGHLSDVVTTSGYVVSPVVGAIPWPVSLRLAVAEVEDVIRIPVAALAHPQLAEERELALAGRTVASPVYHYGQTQVWGATARIIAELVERLTGGSPAAGA